jgi:hypothetical protein
MLQVITGLHAPLKGRSHPRAPLAENRRHRTLRRFASLDKAP